MSTTIKQANKIQPKAGDDLLKALALLPPLLLKISYSHHFIIHSAIIFASFGFWHWIFSTKRSQPAGFDWIFPAALLCLLLPVTASLWQVTLVASFGMIAGEQIYGGRGYSFTSPALLALALLFYSFEIPASGVEGKPTLPFYSQAILLLPAFVLLFYRKLDFLVLIAILSVFLGLPVLTDTAVNLIATISVIACVFYCSCDPLLCPRNLIGRLLYGSLVGGLIYLLDPGFSLIEKTVFACLLGTISAPLLDQFGQFLSGMITRAENQHV